MADRGSKGQVWNLHGSGGHACDHERGWLPVFCRTYAVPASQATSEFQQWPDPALSHCLCTIKSLFVREILAVVRKFLSVVLHAKCTLVFEHFGSATRSNRDTVY